MNTKEKINGFFNIEIANDAETLKTYSHDASIFEVTPELVVFPKNVEEIKKLVTFVEGERKLGNYTSLTARSGGTDMTGGPLGEHIIVNMNKYLNHLDEVSTSSNSGALGYAIVEPGMFYRDFEKETLKKNLLLPCFPASREICTVGGMVANNSAGEKTLAYGKTERYVEEVAMVLRDGNEYVFKSLTLAELEEKKGIQTLEGDVYRKMHELIELNYDKIMAAKPNVSKNSAGYYLWNVLDKEKGTFDLAKMIVGSQGTFGIITKIRFKLIAPKTHSRMLVVFLNEFMKVAEVAKDILAFGPESFESYDDHTLSVAIKAFPQLIRQMKGGIIKLGIQFLPELWMGITGGMPKLILMAQFTADTEEEAQKQALAAQEGLKYLNLTTKVTRTEQEEQKYWTVRRESFNLLRKRVKELRTAPFIDDIIVRPEELPTFLPKLYSILNEYSLIYTVAGHVGDGNFHIIPLMDFKNEKTRAIIPELSKRVYSLVLEHHGSITAEHNDGLIRTAFLEQMYGADIVKLFAEAKKIFDPDNIFNPRKKVGGDFDYSVAHMVTK